VAECKEILADIMKILESKTIEIIEDPKSEPEVDDKLEPGPEVITELVSLQEEIFFRPTEIEELPIETLVDLSAQPTLELVLPLAVMRVSFFLKIT